jgi:type VI secretion system secreted protein VgrG
MPTRTSLPESVCQNFAVHGGTSIVSIGTVNVTGGDVFQGSGLTTPFTTSVNAAAVEAMRERDDGKIITTTEIGGQTFGPGTWRRVGPVSTMTVAKEQTVALDGEGDPDSVFLFQVGTTMTTGADCAILLINGAQAKNVLWALGTTLTTGTDNIIQGSIMANTAVTIGAGTIVYGSVIMRTAVTFGAQCKVYDGCVVALSVITFGTFNTVCRTNCGEEV